MNPSNLLHSVEAIRSLSERLAVSAKVRRYDSPDEPQSWTLSYHFSELERSFTRFTNELLPELHQTGLSEQQIDDLLHKIGEELRHISYHINASEFYAYLREQEDPRE